MAQPSPAAPVPIPTVLAAGDTAAGASSAGAAVGAPLEEAPCPDDPEPKADTTQLKIVLTATGGTFTNTAAVLAALPTRLDDVFNAASITWSTTYVAFSNANKTLTIKATTTRTQQAAIWAASQSNGGSLEGAVRSSGALASTVDAQGSLGLTNNWGVAGQNGGITWYKPPNV